MLSLALDDSLCYYSRRMATTILSAFQTFRQNLEITDLQGETVSTRQSNIRSAIESELTVDESFLTGSYRRNTMIAPLKEADVDIFVVLGSDYYHYYQEANGYANVLEMVKRVLLKTYTKSPHISRNGQAVTIRFSDFIVDVVPAFPRQGGGYVIPTTAGQGWITTDPRVHVQVSADFNTMQQGKFVPLVKMVKAWNKSIGGVFRSFYLELMVRQIFLNTQIGEYPSSLLHFFQQGQQLIRQAMTDTAYSGNVYGLNGISVDEAVSRFSTALGRASNAVSYERNGKTGASIEEWRKIFNDYFPAYG